MLHKEASVNGKDPENQPLPGENYPVDVLSAPGRDKPVQWDPELLKPFIFGRKPDYRPSELEVFQKVLAEGTACLLYERIKETTDSEQAGWLFRNLQQGYYHNLAQNIRWSEQFLRDFPQITHNCPTILLKGISLLNSVYSNPGLRHLGDIDLLIRKEDYPRLRQDLEAAGYVFSDQMEGRADPRDLNSILCGQNSSSTQPALHIHWHLINTLLPVSLTEPQVDLDALWKQSAPLPDHPSLLILSPTHQVIYYCYHLLKHSFDRLILLHDLDRTIRHYHDSLKWSEVLSETRDFNFARTVYYPLHLAKRMLDTPIPDSIIDDLRPERLTFLESRMLQRLNEGGKPVYGHAIIYLAVQKGWYNKLRFLYRCFFPALPEHKPATLVYLAKRAIRGLRRSLELAVTLWRR